jgi:hypothetical protein
MADNSLAFTGSESGGDFMLISTLYQWDTCGSSQGFGVTANDENVAKPSVRSYVSRRDELRRWEGTMRSGMYEVQGKMAAEWRALKAERVQLDARETALIMKALENANGIVAIAARELGIARTTLASRLKVLGVRSEGMTSSNPPAAVPQTGEPAARGATGASRP